MEESFEIPVLYRNQELLFTGILLTFGYVHKFQVDVFGQEVFFEQDDNGEYRALIDPAFLEEANKLDKSLLKEIASSIQYILK